MAASTPLRIGSFEVEKEVGRGGMGVVYFARHALLRHPVALKILNDDLAATKGYVERFLLEARTAARISHPNVVRVYDAGEQDGRYYIAMEFVEGINLAEVVKQHGPLSSDVARQYLLQTAAGLAEAHRYGLLHRDLKPDNLLLTPEGIVKITDFGLAKELLAESRLTQTGIVLGTPAYMSPEQCEARTLTAASDLYSLGATFFHLVTGRLPFDADSVARLLMQHIEAPVPYAQDAHPDVDPDFANLLAQLMAKRPEARYADAGALHRFLESGLASTPATRPVAQGRTTLWLAAAGVLVLVGVLAAWLPRREPGPQTAATNGLEHPEDPPPPRNGASADPPIEVAANRAPVVPLTGKMPDDPAQCVEQAGTAVGDGALDRAAELLRHAKAREPGRDLLTRIEALSAHRSARARAERAIALERWADAEAALDEALAKLALPGSEARRAAVREFQVHYTAGNQAMDAGKYDEAEAAFVQAQRRFDTPLVRVRLEDARAKLAAARKDGSPDSQRR